LFEYATKFRRCGKVREEEEEWEEEDWEEEDWEDEEM
jgi:hypothetical protein